MPVCILMQFWLKTKLLTPVAVSILNINALKSRVTNIVNHSYEQLNRMRTK